MANVTVEKQSMRPLVKRLMNGWKLHIWRMTTPWNYWIVSPTGRAEIHLDRREGMMLQGICREKRRSEELVPHTPIRNSDGGMPRETIYVL